MAQLPLVVAVDCLAEHAALLRRTLSSVAAVEGTGAGWGAAAAPQDRVSGAALVLARSLHELSPGVLALLRGVPAVVLLCPWEGSTEEALGAELGIRRVVRAGPPADEERADTALALLLALARRTHALAREVARGAWLPAPSAYRGARRCAGLHLALVGLDGCAAGSACLPPDGVILTRTPALAAAPRAWRAGPPLSACVSRLCTLLCKTAAWTNLRSLARRMLSS
jgi:hypothetical protein